MRCGTQRRTPSETRSITVCNHRLKQWIETSIPPTFACDFTMTLS